MANSRKSTPKAMGTVTGRMHAVPTSARDHDEMLKEKALAQQLTLAQVAKTIELQGPFLIPVFDQLQTQIYTAMNANGFWDLDSENFGLKVALIHTELSELLEANRNGIDSDDKIPEFTGEEAEAADTIIRLLDMAGRYNWRLGEAIVAKMQYNMTRPHKHGKKY
jgi:hypothetical protein